MKKLTVKRLEWEDNPHWDLRIDPKELIRSPFKDPRPFIKTLSIERGLHSPPPERPGPAIASSSQSGARTQHPSQTQTQTPDDPVFTLTFQTQALPNNRAMSAAHAPRFLHLNVSALRFPNRRPSDTGDYISKILKAGIRINSVTYWFFGHSNSHLRARSCILMSAESAQEIYEMVTSMGNFQSIKTVAKCEF